MILPESEKDLVEFARRLVDVCGNDRGQRTAAYRSYAAWVERGQDTQGAADWMLALCNLLYSHIDRLASHLFSPTDLRFTIDFDLPQEAEWQARAQIAARLLSREWERHNLDMMFGLGVFQSLVYGCAIPKLLPRWDGHRLTIGMNLVMPWNFAVYDPGRLTLDEQECVVETVYLTKPEVWRRVRNLPDAKSKYERIIAASRGETDSMPQSFMHQVLSTLGLDPTRTITSPPIPGGVVQVSSSGAYPSLGPQSAAELYAIHEIWVRDDERGDDWTTLQMADPDVLISGATRRINIATEAKRQSIREGRWWKGILAGGYRDLSREERQKLGLEPWEDKRSKNLFVKDTLPYAKIQPNMIANFFWGRSEVTDLMQLQAWLTEHLGDVKAIMGKQVDRIIGFEGLDGLPDEQFLKMKDSGFYTAPQGTTIKDMSPQMPPDALPLVKLIIELMDKVSGFSPILAGSGEQGVRAGVHAETLMRTASPRLRDRSLLVERNCATLADAYLACMEAKDPAVYWSNPKDHSTDFLIGQMLEDRRVSVDSHSSSPIYMTDHAQLNAWALQHDVIGPEDALEDLPFTHKDLKLQRLKERKAAEQQFIQQHPEVLSGKKGKPTLKAV